MADGPTQPSLTVLSGPKAGTQFLIEDVVDNLLIGSGPECTFRIDAEGVSPIHARLWVDQEGITVYETNSPRGVYVNDDHVAEKANLRNGDILWLGPPGDERSTMLQCRVPARSAKAPAATEPAEDSGATQAFRSPFAAGGPYALGAMPAAPEDHEETVGMARPEFDVPAAVTADAVIETDDLETPEVEAVPVPEPVPEPVAEAVPEEAGIESEPDESPSAYDPDSTRALGQVSGAPAAEAEPAVGFAPEATREPAPEPEPTVAIPYHDTDPLKFDVDLPPDLSPPPVVEHAFEEDIDETVVLAYALETETVVAPREAAPPAQADNTPPAPAVATPDTPGTSDTSDLPEEATIGETVLVAQAAETKTVIEPPPAPAPVVVSPEPRKTPPPEPAPRVVAPSVPPRGPSLRKEVKPEPTVKAPRPATAPPPRVEPGRPSARPVPAAPPVAPPATPKAPAPASSGRGLAIGVGLLVVVGLGVGAFLLLRPGVSPVTPPPTSLAAATPEPAVSLTPAPAELPTAEPVPEATPPIEEEVTMVPGATPRPRPSPTLSPSPRTAASPAARPGLPTPAAATAPPQQASVAVRVAGLMAQAQTAVASANYDAAVAHYDEVLKLDPQNAAAQAARTTTVSARAASRKSFVIGRTVVQAGKAKADLSGFDTADVSVQKAPDFSGRLEFSMSPAKPRPGDSYTLQIALMNDGKKAIKVSGLNVTTVVNGARSGGPMAPRVREIAPKQRAVLEELPGVWPPDVSSWSTEVQVTAGKDESLRGQVSWR